jgi:hypothetical protein
MLADQMSLIDSCTTPFALPPRLLYVSKKGTLFISPGTNVVDETLWGLYRSADGGVTWRAVLTIPVWRMTEDDQGNLYAGNYGNDRMAELFKSSDGGAEWQAVFQDSTNEHVHTIGFDPITKKLYMAVGDTKMRGQLVSADRGLTWSTLSRGPLEGHTDLGFTRRHVIWATDNATGTVLRQDKQTGVVDTFFTGGQQLIWFVISDGADLIYFGSVSSRAGGGEVPSLCGSADQGQTWQKLIELPATTGAYQGFNLGCYHPSTAGYVFVSTGSIGYRVRMTGNQLY